jgi:hypothetical protein
VVAPRCRLQSCEGLTGIDWRAECSFIAVFSSPCHAQARDHLRWPAARPRRFATRASIRQSRNAARYSHPPRSTSGCRWRTAPPRPLPFRRLSNSSLEVRPAVLRFAPHPHAVDLIVGMPMPEPTSVTEIDLTPVPGKRYFNTRAALGHSYTHGNEIIASHSLLVCFRLKKTWAVNRRITSGVYYTIGSTHGFP